jgi:integrase
MSVTFSADKKTPWIVKYREPWSGRPRRRSFVMEADALSFEVGQRDLYDREREIVKRVKRRRAAHATSITVNDLLYRYLDSLATPSTRASSEYHIKLFCDIYGTRKAHCLCLGDMAAYITIQQQRGAGLSTAYRRLRIVRAAYNWGLLWGLLAVNPLSGLRIPTVPVQTPMPPTLQEARLLYNSAAPHVQRVIVLGMTAGPRIGPSELFRLQWSDVDTVTGIVRMPNARKGSPDAARDVPLRSDVLRMIRRWAVADAASGCPWVIHHKGKPIRTISCAWHNAKRRAGITRKLRPYDLRHAFASILLDNGADIKCVSECMGHKDTAMILKYYRHTNAQQRRKAVNAGPSLGLTGK